MRNFPGDRHEAAFRGIEQSLFHFTSIEQLDTDKLNKTADEL